MDTLLYDFDCTSDSTKESEKYVCENFNVLRT